MYYPGSGLGSCQRCWLAWLLNRGCSFDTELASVSNRQSQKSHMSQSAAVPTDASEVIRLVGLTQSHGQGLHWRCERDAHTCRSHSKLSGVLSRSQLVSSMAICRVTALHLAARSFVTQQVPSACMMDRLSLALRTPTVFCCTQGRLKMDQSCR